MTQTTVADATGAFDRSTTTHATLQQAATHRANADDLQVDLSQHSAIARRESRLDQGHASHDGHGSTGTKHNPANTTQTTLQRRRQPVLQPNGPSESTQRTKQQRRRPRRRPTRGPITSTQRRRQRDWPSATVGHDEGRLQKCRDYIWIDTGIATR